MRVVQCEGRREEDRDGGRKVIECSKTSFDIDFDFDFDFSLEVEGEKVKRRCVCV